MTENEIRVALERMTPAQREATKLRVLAGVYQVEAARLRLNAECALAGEAIQAFCDAVTASEARELATHPDLAELNLTLNNYYPEATR